MTGPSAASGSGPLPATDAADSGAAVAMDPSPPPADLTAVWHQIPVAMVVIDDRGAVLRANPEASARFGLATIPDPGARIDGLDARPDRVAPSRALPVTVRLPDGDRRVALAWPADRAEGMLGRSVVLVEPGTVGEQVTGHRRRADDLLRSNRALDSFASVVSHDLKAPLRGIESLVSWVLQDVSDDLPDGSRQHLEQAQRRSSRLMQMLDDLLAYARLGDAATTGAVDAPPIELRAVLADIEDVYLPADRFSLVLPASLPTVAAPSALVELVLRNLAMNAVAHHDRPEGTLVVRDRSTADEVRLALSDDGPGVDPRHGDRIFELFTSLEASGERTSSGMGLAIARRAMDVMGGHLVLEPAEGRGATFLVVWPRPDRECTGARPEPQAPPQ